MRADLQERYGVRLREWMQDRTRWGELLELIDQLPVASRTKAAMLNDPLVAREIVESAEAGEESKWLPPVSEWTLDVASFAAVYDRLGDLIDTVVTLKTGKRATKSKPFPRPVTEVDRLRDNARREAAEDLIALFGGRRRRTT